MGASGDLTREWGDRDDELPMSRRQAQLSVVVSSWRSAHYATTKWCRRGEARSTPILPARGTSCRAIAESLFYSTEVAFFRGVIGQRWALRRGLLAVCRIARLTGKLLGMKDETAKIAM